MVGWEEWHELPYHDSASGTASDLDIAGSVPLKRNEVRDHVVGGFEEGCKATVTIECARAKRVGLGKNRWRLGRQVAVCV